MTDYDPHHTEIVRHVYTLVHAAYGGLRSSKKQHIWKDQPVKDDHLPASADYYNGHPNAKATADFALCYKYEIGCCLVFRHSVGCRSPPF